MDYYLREVDVEVRHLQRMDYYQDVALQDLVQLELVLLVQRLLQLALLPVLQLLHHDLPLTLRDQHRALLRVLLRVLDLLLLSLERLPSLRLPSLQALPLQLALHLDTSQ
jgi:hypothetical protein